MTSKFVRYVKNNPIFNHASASEPPIGTIGVLGTNPECPDNRVTVDFFCEDLGYSPSDEYIITQFVFPECIEETDEPHPILEIQRLNVSSYPRIEVTIDHNATLTPVDSKNLAGHKAVTDIYNEEMVAAMERIKERINSLTGVTVDVVDTDDAASTTKDLYI